MDRVSNLSPAQRKWSDRLFATYDPDGRGTLTEDSFMTLLRLVDPEIDSTEIKATLEDLQKAAGDSSKGNNMRTMAELLEEVKALLLSMETPRTRNSSVTRRGGSAAVSASRVADELLDLEKSIEPLRKQHKQILVQVEGHRARITEWENAVQALQAEGPDTPGRMSYAAQANTRLNTQQQELMSLKKQCKTLAAEIKKTATIGSGEASDEGAMSRKHSIAGLLEKLKETAANSDAPARLVRAAGKCLTQAKADAQSSARSINQSIKKYQTTKARCDAKLQDLAKNPATALPESLVRTIEDLVPTAVQLADLREEYSRLMALQVHTQPKAVTISRGMFYLWVEDILGECEDYDFKDSIEALIEASKQEEESSSDEGESEAAAKEDLALGAEVGDLLRQYQQSEAASQKKASESRAREKGLELDQPAQEEEEEENATVAAAAQERAARQEERKRQEEERQRRAEEAKDAASGSAADHPSESSECDSSAKGTSESKSSVGGVLSGTRLHLTDGIFVAGASDGTGSLDAALLLRAVRACSAAAEWDACIRSLGQAEEETFGLCRADFDVWVAEMFADVDDERFEACAAELEKSLRVLASGSAAEEATATAGDAAPSNAAANSTQVPEKDTPSADTEKDTPRDGQADDETHGEYMKTLKEADSTDFTALMRMGFLHVVRDEALGQPVVVILARNINIEDMDVELALKFLVWMLDTIADSKFAFIYLNAEASMDNVPPISWMSEIKRVLPRKYRKNITAFYIVEPSLTLKATIGVLTPFISRKFWKKLTFVDSINELFHQDSKVGFCCHHLLQWKRDGK